MQITITQSEIEAAIKAHILGVIAINPDQEITVDLKATRGETGYQAIIDISPIGTQAQAQAAEAAQSQTRLVGGVVSGKPRLTVAAPSPGVNQVPVRTPAAVRAMMEQEQATEEATEEAAQAGEDGQPVEETGTEEEPAQEAPEAPAEEAPAPRRLGRPPGSVKTAPEPPVEQVAGAPPAEAPAPRKLFGGFTKPKN